MRNYALENRRNYAKNVQVTFLHVTMHKRLRM